MATLSELENEVGRLQIQLSFLHDFTIAQNQFMIEMFKNMYQLLDVNPGQRREIVEGVARVLSKRPTFTDDVGMLNNLGSFVEEFMSDADESSLKKANS
ncbi:MAG TPA: hypothetical protein ENK01_04755 [Hellea balneolensis]|uniref:Uncharacterized protein n=1 Tax=Hellea balneolensis TaxID=287478 RepID=A0A7V5NXR8_9PROT|nr:hypothetical protein [Hellea balneolensis]